MLYLKRVRFENVRGFKSLDLPFHDGERRRPFTILIGNNGRGKTWVLRGIALGLCDEKTASEFLSRLPGEFIRIPKRRKTGAVGEATIEIELAHDQAGELTTLRTTISRDDQGELRVRKTIPKEFRWGQVFAAGYGSNRGIGGRACSSYALRNSLLTLFNDRAGLLDPESTLRAFALLSANVSRRETTLSQVRRLLWRLWGVNPGHEPI
jgi:hypothetical protein